MLVVKLGLDISKMMVLKNVNTKVVLMRAVNTNQSLKTNGCQHTKMVNQILIAGNMAGMCEALLYARRAGLDTEKVMNSVAAGAAGSWSLSNLGPRILRGDFAPGFFVEHFIKDMKIALDEAARMNLRLPALDLVRRLYERLAAHGGARLTVGGRHSEPGDFVAAAMPHIMEPPVGGIHEPRGTRGCAAGLTRISMGLPIDADRPRGRLRHTMLTSYGGED